MASGIQLSGLASGFDWKSFTDRIMELERAPARRYAAEQVRNDAESSELSTLGSRLSSLQSAVDALSNAGLGSGRKIVNLSGSAKLTASTSSATPLGSYSVQVTQVPVAHRLVGKPVALAEIGAGKLELRASDDAELIEIPVSADMSVEEIVSAINTSDAGITAITDGSQVVLTSQLTGAGNKIFVGSTPLAAILGLSDPAVEELPLDGEFTINGLSFSSPDDVLDEDDHGIAGLSFKTPAEVMAQSETFKVSSDTSQLRSLIDTFVASYNNFASFVATKTEVTTSAGKTTAGPLAANREVQNWLKELRSAIFGAPAFGDIKNISSLGLDFSSSDDLIKVTDSAKLDAVLAKNSADVVRFFNLDAVGLATRVSAKLNSFIGEDGSAGLLKTKLDSYVAANMRLNDQIAALDRYLEQRRAQLEAGFIAMEAAQSKMSQIQTMLTNSFGQKK
jgi:flagellar hook-associated protein 2